MQQVMCGRDDSDYNIDMLTAVDIFEGIYLSDFDNDEIIEEIETAQIESTNPTEPSIATEETSKHKKKNESKGRKQKTGKLSSILTNTIGCFRYCRYERLS